MEDKTAPTSSTPYNPQDPLETFDWEDLEARYHAKMAHCEAAEGEIYKEFEEWLKVNNIPPCLQTASNSIFDENANLIHKSDFRDLDVYHLCLRKR